MPRWLPIGVVSPCGFTGCRQPQLHGADTHFFCSVVAILCCLRPRRHLCQPPLRWRRGCGTCRRRHCQSAATGCSSHRHLGSGRQPLRRRERRPDLNSRQWESWRAPPPRGPPRPESAPVATTQTCTVCWSHRGWRKSTRLQQCRLWCLCSPFAVLAVPPIPAMAAHFRQWPAVSAIAAVAAVTAVAVDQVAACDVGALQQDWYLGNPTVRVDQLSINVAEITTRLDRIAGGGQLR